ncbi:MAG: response regulator [Xenococcaceae cyanobacterium]
MSREVFMVYDRDRKTKYFDTIPASAPALNGLKILVVDDLPSNLEVIKMILETYGAEVEVAASAREALNALLCVDIDVLISDICMPNEDGYDLIRQVRQLPNKVSIPALALTASATESNRLQAFVCGFQCYMTKPFEPVELVDKVAQLTRSPKD